MSIEDILYEAEKFGLRSKVLMGVGELRTKAPSIQLKEAYEIVWDEVKKEQRV